MKSAWRGIALGSTVLLAALLLAEPALGSGDPIAGPTYIDERGGTPAEIERFFAGRAGVVLVAGTDGMLFANWRLLHGLPVGSSAGAKLAKRCCTMEAYGEERRGVEGWLKARELVAGSPEIDSYLRLGRVTEDYVYQPICLGDAFDTATATLTDRVRRHGGGSPAVRAWVASQDLVFASCDGSAHSLPPLPGDAPEWLRKDRDYQQAALALYSRRLDDAAQRFRAIAQDPASPWQPYGQYLVARAQFNAAIEAPSASRFAAARASAQAVIDAPGDVFGRVAARSILRALDYRQHPAELLRQLDQELTARTLPGDVDMALRDYVTLRPPGVSLPDLADWMSTIRGNPPNRASLVVEQGWLAAIGLAWVVDALDGTPTESALEHATRRWKDSSDTAWLVAALALTPGNTSPSASIITDAQRVPATNPAWLTAQYHLHRLTVDSAKPSDLRRSIDSILARRDLTRTDRNLFMGLRTQVAVDLRDFIRASLREPYCRDSDPRPCTSIYDPNGDITLGHRAAGPVGFGEDARAIIDRMPLAMRAEVARDASLPAELRLDVALTNFSRAVALRDSRTAELMAGDLARLLPQLGADWQRVVTSRGSAKRYAQLFAMAKLPGLRPDLATYYRPRGTVRQFKGYWARWMMFPAGAEPPGTERPPARSYNADSIAGRYDVTMEGYSEGGEDDLVCRGKCGAGGRPIHLPRFVAEAQPREAVERSRYLADGGYLDEQAQYPAGTVVLWDELLDQARANPSDPRSPEALYWLIRIGRWGGGYNHLSKRAFQLLHKRYPGSVWAKRSPYHYD